MNIKANGTKALLFDLDGTLRHSVPHGFDVFWEFVVGLGVEKNEHMRRQAAQWAHQYWADSEYLLVDIETYGHENDEFWVNYTRRQMLAMGVNGGQVGEWALLAHENFRENYNPEDMIPEDVFETLPKLREAGYTVGVVTNRSDPIDEYMAKTKLDTLVNFYLTAGEIGSWKPSPEIFYYALGLANAKPEEALYIGDNYFADVLGAKKANIPAVLFDMYDVFPDADVPVIRSIGELGEMVLEKK